MCDILWRNKMHMGFFGKTWRKEAIWRPSIDGMIILNTHLTKAGCESVDLIDLAGNRDKCQAVVDTVMNLQLLLNAGNCWTSWGSVSLVRRTVLHGISYIKVKLSMLTGGGEVQFHSFNISELDGCVFNIMTWLLYPWERNPGTHWIGGWVSPTNNLKKKKISCPGHFREEENL